MTQTGAPPNRFLLSAILVLGLLALLLCGIDFGHRPTPASRPAAAMPLSLPAIAASPLLTGSLQTAQPVRLAASNVASADIEFTNLPRIEPTMATSMPPVLPTPAAEEELPDVNQLPPLTGEPVESSRLPATGDAAPQHSDQTHEMTQLPPADSVAAGDNSQTAPRPATSPRLPPDLAAAFAVKPKPQSTNEEPLLPVSGPSESTPELIALARRADAHVARGLDLAQRGASYTARAEFLAALQLSASALDQQRQTSAHSRAIAHGLQALEEAADFAPVITAARTPRSIIESHHTPHGDALDEDALPGEYMQSYLSYAQKQFAAGAGDLQPAASALYALGKLEMQSPAADIGSIATARAAVYFQAALEVNPQHALAANELGVLLARSGRLAEAKAALVHSVRVGPQAVAWRNLAVVHWNLGETDLANRAIWEASQLAARAAGGPGGAQPQVAAHVNGQNETAALHVQWLDPAAFASTSNSATQTPVAMTAAAASAPQRAANSPDQRKPRRTSSLFPWPGMTR